MNNEKMNQVQKLTLSAMVIALYVVILYFTQSFSFGAYQIRIATSLYALSYIFPFLVFPLGLANFIANMLFGGFGIADMLGGCLVGMATTVSVVAIRKLKWNRCLIALPIILVPGLGVATYLCLFLNLPYGALAMSLCIGQTMPAVVGVLLVQSLEPVLSMRRRHKPA